MNNHKKAIKVIRLIAFSLLVTAMSALVSGCNLPTGETSMRGPRAWIDKPLDGDTLPLAPVEVVSHASDKAGAQSMELHVNGEQVRVDAGMQDGSLTSFSQLWEPPGPGEYTLVVVASNPAGGTARSQPVTVMIGGEKIVENDQEEIPSPTSSATATSTPELDVTETPTITPTMVEEACTNQIQFAGQTIPDGTIFEPTTAFTKTWTLVNAGTCIWTEEYALVFLSGDQLGAASRTGLDESVEPDDSITLSANMQAPNNPGEYFGTWMLSDPEGNLFGLGDDGENSFWVKIVVQIPTVTPEALEAPFAPSNLQVSSENCTAAEADVTLTWTDNAGNEDGFRVYRDGSLIQTLGVDATTYSDSVSEKNTDYTYAVEAFNSGGTSSKATVTETICSID